MNNKPTTVTPDFSGDIPEFRERIHATSNFPSEISHFYVAIPSKMIDGLKVSNCPVSCQFLSLEAAERALPSFKEKIP